jgi:leader peptidase (prepilin peptidase)/N-methyltransferase
VIVIPPEPVPSLFALAFGLVLGSFLNVCIHRLPLEQSIVSPGSRCPSCGTAIRWYQNVPVLSWLALRGKCASCSSPISVRYPAIEALSGLVVLLCWRYYGPSPAFAVSAPYILAMIVLFFTDWDHRILPNAVTLPGAVAGLAVAWFNPFLGDPGWTRVWMAASGAALGSGALWAVGALYSRLRGVEAMGMGDVKMMALVGAFAGPAGVVFTIFGGSIAGAVIGLVLIRLRGGSMRDKLPFGCFLAPAAVAGLLVGRQALAAYLDLFAPGL